MSEREVKILKALAGNKNLVQFYDAYEDNDNILVSFHDLLEVTTSYLLIEFIFIIFCLRIFDVARTTS
jgi:serine/threonine protein kinase